MLYTTLNKIRARGPCGIENQTPPTGFRKLMVYLRKSKPDDEPISFAAILASNGIEDALWCLRSIDEPVFCRLLAVKFAREVQHLMQDPRSLAALNVAERYARGEASADASAEALAEARRTAYYAYADADAAACATSAAYAATYATYATYADAAAAYAAYASADAHYADATATAAYYAASATATAAYYAAADAYARSEARSKMRERQAEIFLEMLDTTPVPV